MGLCSLKKHSYSPSKSRVCCFRLKSKSQAKLARSISTLNNINASIVILQKSNHVSLSYMQKSPHTSPPRPHWLQTAKGQLETSLEWEIWNRLPRSLGIFSSFIKHTFSNNFKWRYDKTFLNLSNSVAAEAQLTARTCRKYSSSCQIYWVLTLEILPVLAM